MNNAQIYTIEKNKKDGEMFEVTMTFKPQTRPLITHLAFIIHGDLLDEEIKSYVDRDGYAEITMEVVFNES